MNYRHSQRAPLALLLGSVGGGLVLGAVMLWREGFVALAVGVIGVVFLALAASFSWLRVEDRGEHLAVRFGPLPLFGTRIAYSSIRAAAAGRSALIDGWGIHWIPGRGWTYNLWGRGCVEIRTERGIVRVGTDDPEGLARFLEEKAVAGGA